MNARLVNRPLVCADRPREAPALGGLVQQSNHVLPAHAVIHGDVHALAAEVIHHRQALDAPAVGQGIHHEVHAPGVVDILAGRQGLTLADGALDLAALAHRQVGLLVQAPNAFVVHLPPLQGQQIVKQPLVIALIAVPILIQVYFTSGLAYLLNRRLGVAHCVAGPSALIGASNFFELAVATAVGLFGVHSGAALATVVGVLIEVPVMLSVVRIVNRTQAWYERPQER